MPQDYDGNGSRIYVVAQITLLLAAIVALLFSSILFGIGSSLGEINTSIPISAGDKKQLNALVSEPASIAQNVNRYVPSAKAIQWNE